VVARKRSDQRIRRNKDPEGIAVAKAPGAAVVKPPRVSPKWRPMVKDWFRSLKESGQAQFFEPTDWQMARLAAEQMNMLLVEAEESGQAIRATAFESLWAAMGDLLTTEGARRKVKVELQRGSAVEDPDRSEVVSIMDDYRNMLESG